MNFQFLIKLVICSCILYSCSSDQEESNADPSESNSIVTILKNVANNNLNEDDFVRFDITIDANDNIDLSNKKLIEKTRHSEVFLNYQRKANGIVIQMPTQAKSTITVCCTTDGDEYECETCPDGAGQNLCIIRAINACTDSGGCAVVCENKMYYNPTKNEFWIIRK